MVYVNLIELTIKKKLYKVVEVCVYICVGKQVGRVFLCLRLWSDLQTESHMERGNKGSHISLVQFHIFLTWVSCVVYRFHLTALAGSLPFFHHIAFRELARCYWVKVLKAHSSWPASGKPGHTGGRHHKHKQLEHHMGPFNDKAEGAPEVF